MIAYLKLVAAVLVVGGIALFLDALALSGWSTVPAPPLVQVLAVSVVAVMVTLGALVISARLFLAAVRPARPPAAPPSTLSLHPASDEERRHMFGH